MRFALPSIIFATAALSLNAADSAHGKKLIEFGMPEDMLSLFSDADIVENARSMGLLNGNKEIAE